MRLTDEQCESIYGEQLASLADWLYSVDPENAEHSLWCTKQQLKYGRNWDNQLLDVPLSDKAIDSIKETCTTLVDALKQLEQHLDASVSDEVKGFLKRAIKDSELKSLVRCEVTTPAPNPVRKS